MALVPEGRPLAYGIIGAAILILYGIIPTFQSAHFGRVYAAYGGMFIVLSLSGDGPDGVDPTRSTSLEELFALWVWRLLCMRLARRCNNEVLQWSVSVSRIHFRTKLFSKRRHVIEHPSPCGADPFLMRMGRQLVMIMSADLMVALS